MFKSLLLPEDLKEKAVRELFLQREELRKKRIFNCKLRQIGVDIDALNKQVIEKQVQESRNRTENDRYSLVQNRMAEAAIEREQRLEMQRRQIGRELQLFRNVYQKKQLSNDYDLEVQVDADEGSSDGVTKFEGEDPHLKDRLAHQKWQQRNWLTQQILEKNMKSSEVKKAEKAFDESLNARVNRWTSLDNMEKQCKREVQRAVSDINRTLSARKRHERHHQLLETRQSDEADVYNCLTSDLLMENPELARSNLGSNRYNSMMFKGMSAEERDEIRRAQLRQIEEAKARKALEKKENEIWEIYEGGLRNTVFGKTQRTANAIRDRDLRVKEYNKTLSEQQKARKSYVNNVLLANEISEDFFDYFNKSTR